MVDLKKDECWIFVEMKMSHKMEKVKKSDDTKQLFRSQEDRGGWLGWSPDEKFVSKVPLETNMNGIILFNGAAKLLMKDCMIALNQKQFKLRILPGITVNQGDEVLFIECEIKGTSSKNQDAMKQGDLILRQQKRIQSYIYGGVLIQQASKNVHVSISKIIQNKQVGIHVTLQ